MRDFGNTNATWIGLTPPPSPIPGQFWWRTDPDQSLYVYYDDGSSQQWVAAVPTTQFVGAAAGGDLAGTFPNPTLKPGVINDADVTDVGWSKITGAPTSFPPSGTVPAGDLTGTYPSPTLKSLGAQVVRSTLQTIGTGSETIITFDQAFVNRGGCWVSGTPTQLQLLTPGAWLCGGNITWNATASLGARIIMIRNKAGAEVCRQDSAPNANGWYGVGASGLYFSTDPTDYLTCRGYQSTGANLDTVAGQVRFYAWRVGS